MVAELALMLAPKVKTKIAMQNAVRNIECRFSFMPLSPVANH
jgi:hypothetical protein